MEWISFNASNNPSLLMDEEAEAQKSNLPKVTHSLPHTEDSASGAQHCRFTGSSFPTCTKNQEVSQGEGPEEPWGHDACLPL